MRLDRFDYREHVPYHVIVRAKRGAIPFSDPRLALMACELLFDVFGTCEAYLGAFCLMPDHLHVLMSPDLSGLSVGEIVGRYKGLTTDRSWTLGWSGTLWQRRFFDHIVRKSEGIKSVAEYIYANPARKGLPDGYPHRWFDPDLP